MHTYIYIYIYIHMYICICTSCIYIYACIHVCVCLYIHIRIAVDIALHHTRSAHVLIVCHSNTLMAAQSGESWSVESIERGHGIICAMVKTPYRGIIWSYTAPLKGLGVDVRQV